MARLASFTLSNPTVSWCLWGVAGMAPLWSHLAFLLETQKSQRHMGYCDGARIKQTIFYSKIFWHKKANFSFHIALSEPQAEDEWTSHTGFIHEVLKEIYLDKHTNPLAVDYYVWAHRAYCKLSPRCSRHLEYPTHRLHLLSSSFCRCEKEQAKYLRCHTAMQR